MVDDMIADMEADKSLIVTDFFKRNKTVYLTRFHITILLQSA